MLEDEIVVSKQSIRLFLKCFKERGIIARKCDSGLSIKLSPSLLQIIESAIRNDDKTTATQLQGLLASHNVYVSLSTILRHWRQLGWVYRGPAYCQLIRSVNKQKRLEWAHEHLHDSFENVFWSDESSSHQRYCYRKKGERPRPKPRLKPPTKVHVLAGISKRGATGVCVFEGRMDAPLFAKFFSELFCHFFRKIFGFPQIYAR